MSTTSPEEQAKLDAALDAALDELDDSDDDNDMGVASRPQAQCTATSKDPAVSTDPKSPVMGPPRPPKVSPLSEAGVGTAPNEWSPNKLFEDMMKQMIEGSLSGSPVNASVAGKEAVEDEFMGQLLSEMQKMQQHLGEGPFENEPRAASSKPSTKDTKTKPNKKKEEKKPSKANGPSTSSCTSEKAQVEEAFSNLLQGIAEQSSRIADTDANTSNNIESGSEFDMIQSLLDTLASAAGMDDMPGGDGNGEAFDPDAVVDGMMEQLLSKDLMYEPMKQVATRFPAWLQEHQSTLSPKEYSERQKQCDCFVRLVHVYETEPSNVGKLMELMQDVQEYGQPPVEIIQAIAPGIELDEKGMPKLDDMGMPFGGTNDECVIM